MLDAEEFYQQLIELGSELPPLPPNQKIDQNRVWGCQSKTWLVLHFDDSNALQISGESDSRLVAGLIAILTQHFGGLDPQQVISLSSDWEKSNHLSDNISTVRQIGFAKMLQKLQEVAQEHKMV